MTSPQGDCYAVIDTTTAKVVATERLTEVCGVAPDRAGFLVTTGTGAIVEPGGGSSEDEEHAWDNHVLRIEA